MLLYYLKVEDPLFRYENMKKFHIREKTERKLASHEDMLEESDHNHGHKGTKKMKLNDCKET